MAKKNKAARITANPFREPKKAKMVTGNVTKLKKLAELKTVNKAIDQMHKVDHKRFAASDKLFNKSRKLKQQLGIS